MSTGGHVDDAAARATAQQRNQALVDSTDARALKDDAVLAPVLALYNQRLAAGADPLRNLTGALLDGFAETREGIRRRMTAKYAGQPDAVAAAERAITNSQRRSGGTNYQSLLGYAYAKQLVAENSAWYLSRPVPKEFTESLVIRHTGQGSQEFRVKPDLDMLFRNAGWQPRDGQDFEPVLLLSAKTSIADRGGMAARWKMYFDLLTKPCCLRDDPACSWRTLGFTFEQPIPFVVTQGIVTANIYKVQSDQRFATRGELMTEQCISNTFMFDMKITTRNDDVADEPEGWADAWAAIHWLAETSVEFELP